MEVNQVAILEATLNRASKTAIFLHCSGILILIFLFRLDPIGYKKFGLVLSIVAFVASIFISRSFFYAEKQLKQCKTDSPRSAVRKFNESFLLFFFPYLFWCSCIGVFL